MNKHLCIVNDETQNDDDGDKMAKLFINSNFEITRTNFCPTGFTLPDLRSVILDHMGWEYQYKDPLH